MSANGTVSRLAIGAVVQHLAPGATVSRNWGFDPLGEGGITAGAAQGSGSLTAALVALSAAAFAPVASCSGSLVAVSPTIEMVAQASPASASGSLSPATATTGSVVSASAPPAVGTGSLSAPILLAQSTVGAPVATASGSLLPVTPSLSGELVATAPSATGSGSLQPPTLVLHLDVPVSVLQGAGSLSEVLVSLGIQVPVAPASGSGSLSDPSVVLEQSASAGVASGSGSLIAANATISSGSGPVLEAQWNFETAPGNVSPEEVSGRAATLVNGATLVSGGPRSNALNVAGGSDRRADVAAFDVTGSEITLVGWVRFDSITGTVGKQGRIISKASSTAEAGHFWMLGLFDNGALRFRLKTGGTTTTLISGTGQVTTGVDYQVAATYDGSNMRIFLDGTEVASTAKTGALSTDAAVAVAIGNQPTGSGNSAIEGRVGEARIYSTALTGAELDAL